MEHSQNIRPGASTDERASPLYPSAAAAPLEQAGSTAPPAATESAEPAPPPPADDRFATEGEERTYWAGVRHGIRIAGREPAHPHMPENFELELTRRSGQPGLVSAKLLDPWPFDASDEAALGRTAYGEASGTGAEPEPEPGSEARSAATQASARKVRHDGWTAERQQIFLATLADTGVVADACRAARIGRDSAYAFRRRASGRAFALAWEAAELIARRVLADDVMSRARYGVVDRVYRDGKLVAERHRYDNRLSMSVLTRLDRTAEGHGDAAPAVRAVAAEFDQFLDLLPHGNEAAEAFLASRFPVDESGAPCPFGRARRRGGDSCGFGGAKGARAPRHLSAVGRRPASRDRDRRPLRNSDGRLDRRAVAARRGKRFPLLPRPRRVVRSGAKRRSRRHRWHVSGSSALPALFSRTGPRGSGGREQAGGSLHECSYREDDDGLWTTDFPPPDGFDGDERGEPGLPGYRRSLTDAEQRAIDLEIERQDEEERERLAAAVSVQAAGRDAFLADVAEGAAARLAAREGRRAAPPDAAS
jgi:hypothetical protein